MLISELALPSHPPPKTESRKNIIAISSDEDKESSKDSGFSVGALDDETFEMTNNSDF